MCSGPVLDAEGIQIPCEFLLWGVHSLRGRERTVLASNYSTILQPPETGVLQKFWEPGGSQCSWCSHSWLLPRVWMSARKAFPVELRQWRRCRWRGSWPKMKMLHSVFPSFLPSVNTRLLSTSYVPDPEIIVSVIMEFKISHGGLP